MINKDVLYVIRHEHTKTVKIGITVDWNTRSKSLKVGEKTSLLKLYNCPDICCAEKELHDAFRDWRLPGSEYFCLNEANLSLLLKTADSKYIDVTNQFKDLQTINNHLWLDISGSVEWSINDWFRLNRTSWFKNVIEYLYINQVVKSKDDPQETLSHEQFCREFYLFFQAVETPHDWNATVRGQLIIEKLWKEITDHYAFAIRKKDFERTGSRNHSYRLPNNYDLSKIKLVNISGRQPYLCDIAISSNTIQVLFENFASYRLEHYVESAYDCFMKDDQKVYYWMNHGPINGNQSCVLSFQ